MNFGAVTVPTESFDSLLQTLQKTVMVAVGYGMLNRSFQWATFAVTPLLVGPAYLEGKVEYGVIAQACIRESQSI